MNALRLYVLACLLCPLLNQQDKPTVAKDVIQIEYLCDCGWRESVKWNDPNVMIKVY